MKLRITRMAGFGRTTPVEFSKAVVTLGSGHGSDVRFDTAWDRGVAPQHARLEWQGDTCHVLDAGSATGTFVDGQRLLAAQAIHGPMEIQLGPGGPRVTVEVIAERESSVVPSPAPMTQSAASPVRAEVFSGARAHTPAKLRIPQGAIIACSILIGLLVAGGIWLAVSKRHDRGAQTPTPLAPLPPLVGTEPPGGPGADKDRLREPKRNGAKLSPEENGIVTEIRKRPSYIALHRFWEEQKPISPYVIGYLGNEDAWYAAMFAYAQKAGEGFPGIFIAECFGEGLGLPGTPTSPPPVMEALKPALLKNPTPSQTATSARHTDSRAFSADAEARSRIQQHFTAYANKLSTTKAAAPKAWAVLMGVNEFESVSPLWSCRNDVAAIAKVLSTQGIFEPERIRILTDTRHGSEDFPTKENVIAAITAVIDQAGPDDVVLIGISSHGGYDPDRGESFFCTVDTKDGMKGIYGSELQALLSKAKARNVLIIIDACHSGGNPALGAAQAFLKRGSPVPTQRQFAAVPESFYERLASARGHVVIRACRADQTTPDLFHIGVGQSLLTLVTLNGLTGDADANGDGIVTLSELRIFVTTAIPKISRLAAEAGEDQSRNHGPLEPTFTSGGFGEAGDLPLTVVAQPNPDR